MNWHGVVPSSIPHSHKMRERNTTVNGKFLLGKETKANDLVRLRTNRGDETTCWWVCPFASWQSEGLAWSAWLRHTQRPRSPRARECALRTAAQRRPCTCKRTSSRTTRESRLRCWWPRKTSSSPSGPIVARSPCHTVQRWWCRGTPPTDTVPGSRTWTPSKCRTTAAECSLALHWALSQPFRRRTRSSRGLSLHKWTSRTAMCSQAGRILAALCMVNYVPLLASPCFPDFPSDLL